MRKDLEDLWFYYLIEVPIKRSSKEKATIKGWAEKEQYFRSRLNDEQLAVLAEYDNAVSEVSRISEKNAFIKGVKFTARFFIEALCND